MNGATPTLSLVLPLHASPRQAVNALASLSAPYQERAESSEVLVIEGESGDLLGEERARECLPHVRYLRDDGPIFRRSRCLQIGFSESRGTFLGVFMDGTHVLTPRVFDLALQALATEERVLVAVPDYRFDAALATWAGHTEAELAWFAESSWRENPYELLSVARFGPATPNGFLGPLLGAGCLFARRESFLALPTPDPSLDLPGAAALRLWLYTELARLPGTRLVVLAGEGAFRLHHAEAALDAVRREEADVQSLVMSAVLPLGQTFRAAHREPFAFGPIPSAARRFVEESEAVAEYHVAACRGRGEPPWYLDP